MYTKKQFSKLYDSKKYSQYVLDTLKYKIKKYTYDTIKSSYLCIRFPFLYPRNRFSDKHYTNWKLKKKYSEIYNKWVDYSKKHVHTYISHFGEECTFFDKTCVKSEYIMKLATPKDKFLYNFYKICENILSIFHFIPAYTEFNSIPKGWRKRFGIQFCKELKEAISKCPDKNYKKNFRIMDIKEKFGKLRVYVNYESKEVQRVIQKYEYISQYVCIACGEDAVKKSLGWISPYCDKCLPEHERWVYINPVYGWSDFEHEKYNEEVLKEIP